MDIVVGQLHERSLGTLLSVREVNKENYAVGLLHVELVTLISGEEGFQVRLLHIGGILEYRNLKS